MACCGLSGCALILCAIDTDISHQPRFQNIVGTVVHTRRKLYLYRRGSHYSVAAQRFYDLRKSTAGIDRHNLVAVVPAGHPVKFTKVLRKRDLESSDDYMYGEITLNGTAYPVEVYLDATLAEDGWRFILHDLLVYKE